MNQGRTLVKKIAAIIGACGTIPKRGYNAFHGYPYATEADISKAIGPLLAEHHLAVFPDVLEQSVIETKNNNNKREFIATVLVEFTIVDGESGEERKIKMGGQGADASDKAIYKAVTGAQKYALMKLFQIETGLDPENENGLHDENKPSATPNKPQTPQKPQGHTNRAPAQNKPAETHTSRQETPKKDIPPAASIEKVPDYEQFMSLCKTLGLRKWSDILNMINTIRKSRNQYEINRWNGLNNEWKVSIFNAFREKLIKKDKPAPGKIETKEVDIPTSGHIAEILLMLDMSYDDLLNYIYKYYGQDVQSFDDLTGQVKRDVYRSLQKQFEDVMQRD